jgi:hypothetical protein
VNERGQATPLLALVVLALGGLIFGLARFGATASHAAQAQAAADAAALAGAAEGRDAATSLAAANGGEILAYDEAGREVEVRALVGDAWAVARARRTGGGGGVTGWVGSEGAGGAGDRLAPDLRRALEAAAELLHQPVPIVRAQGREVAVPGTFAPRLAAVAERVGLCRLPSQPDPVRFAACPGVRR